MGLRKRQSEFSVALGKLLIYIHSKGYETTIEDTKAVNFKKLIIFLKATESYLPHSMKELLNKFIKYLKSKSHSSKSLHYLKLAVDINLFFDGKYLSKTSDHEKFGIYWESLGGSWGGRFKDGNHYSFSYKGRK